LLPAVAIDTAGLALAADLGAASVGRGRSYRDLGDSARAPADFAPALRRDPTYGPAYYGRGWVRHERGALAAELPEAQQGRACATDPARAGRPYRGIGPARHGLKHYPAALAAYDQALAQGPDDEGTLSNRGLCYADRGETSAALADFTRALEQRPRLGRSRRGARACPAPAGRAGRRPGRFGSGIGCAPSYLSAYLGRAEGYAAPHAADGALAAYRQVWDRIPAGPAGGRTAGLQP
jgi:tetratricopeptide (TPR) repeat protein